MSIIDFLIIAVVAAGIIVGGMSGLVKQLSSLLAIVIAIVVTRTFGTEATEMLRAIVPDLTDSATMANVLAHILLFAFVYLTVRLAGSLMHSLLTSLHLGGADHILGAVFCTFKYLLILSIILNLWLFISPESEIVNDSSLFGGSVCRFMLDMAPWLLNSELIPLATNLVH
ncbi:MAG: CvpA family protein [Muribaculaceae bacterium]|nr:CvpA family protein [Muribaculaceae bacterium]